MSSSPNGRPGDPRSGGRACSRSISPTCPGRQGDRPLTQLPTGALIDSLGQDYFHALVCKAALHAFAAENEARMEAMTAAGSQIARELETFQATLRRVRQEAITAEIIELGTGAAAAGAWQMTRSRKPAERAPKAGQFVRIVTDSDQCCTAAADLESEGTERASPPLRRRKHNASQTPIHRARCH